jgi:hypothetical protein
MTSQKTSFDHLTLKSVDIEKTTNYIVLIAKFNETDEEFVFAIKKENPDKVLFFTHMGNWVIINKRKGYMDLFKRIRKKAESDKTITKTLKGGRFLPRTFIFQHNEKELNITNNLNLIEKGTTIADFWVSKKKIDKDMIKAENIRRLSIKNSDRSLFVLQIGYYDDETNRVGLEPNVLFLANNPSELKTEILKYIKK